MKKTLTLLVSCFALSAAQSQPQLTSGKMMPIGSSLKMHRVLDASIIDTTIQGADVTWDFSNLQPNVNEADFTVDVLSPSATPFGASFPTANYTLKEGPDVSYNHYKLTSTKMERVGSYASSANIYSDPQIEYVFPLTLGVSNIDTWASTNSSFGGTYYLKCVGYGTLKLPGMTHDSVLMVTVMLDEFITGITSYFWYSSKNGLPLLQNVVGDGFFFPSFAQYTYTSSVATGVNEIGNLNIQGLTYNNPVEDALTLNFAEDTQPLAYKIVNQLGQTVSSGNVNDIKQNESIQVDMQHMNGGVYFLNLSNQSTGASQTLKFLKK